MSNDLFIAVKVHILVLWIMTLCGLVGWYQHLGITYCLCIQGRSMFLLNIHTRLLDPQRSQYDSNCVSSPVSARRCS
jgi:hypothetical protein